MRLSLAWTAVTAVAILFLAVAMASGSEAHASGLGRTIVERGSAGGAPACITCHGPKLAGNATIGAPAIAGRPADFIVARLVHYAGPDGHNPLMRQVATALTSDERTAVAAYITTLPASPPGKASSDKPH